MTKIVSNKNTPIRNRIYEKDENKNLETKFVRLLCGQKPHPCHVLLMSKLIKYFFFLCVDSNLRVFYFRNLFRLNAQNQNCQSRFPYPDCLT